MELIFSQYEDRLRRLKRKKSTIQGFQQAVRPFEEWLDGRDPRTVQPWEIEEWLAGLEYSPRTKLQYLINLRAAYRYAQRRGMLDHDPTWDVLVEKPPTRPIEVFTHDQLREQRDRAAYSDRLWLLWHLLAYTGMRRHEIEKMTWEDVNLREGYIYVIGKADKERYVPIHPVLGEVLVKAGPGEGRVTRAAHDKNFARLRADGKQGAHTWRRTFATSLADNGVPDQMIDAICGWAPRSVFGRFYRNIRLEQLHEAVLKVYSSDPL